MPQDIVHHNKTPNSDLRQDTNNNQYIRRYQNVGSIIVDWIIEL